MYRHIARTVFATATLGLSGCLLISPHNGQVIASRTADVPFRAWTAKTGDTLKVECMPTNRFGPEVSPHGSWAQFATLPVNDESSLDLSGVAMYGASDTLSLPESCWYLNRSNGWHYTSIRVFQHDYLSAERYPYFTLNKPGSGNDLECVGREVGRTGSWTAWLEARCYLQYTSGDAIPWLIMRTQG